MRIKHTLALLFLLLILALPACGPDTLPASSSRGASSSAQTEFSLSDLPAYSGEAWVTVNGNQPYFTSDDLTTQVFELYSPLDELGRCGVAYANVCQELMPTGERGEIGMIKPTGWHTVRYDDVVDGKYLYNRCHLIGYQLAGENANELNLITGTRAMNVDGMLPFENQVDDYVDETGNHVLYRVTPVFEGDNLVASGVLMEACSVEDGGAGLSFCVYCYNAQPGITIDYATGESWLSGQEPAGGASAPEEEVSYVLNTNSMKFHLPDCSSVPQISPGNRRDFSGSREELLAQGYSPCGACKP